MDRRAQERSWVWFRTPRAISMASHGGVPGGDSGTVFRIDSAGVLTTLHDFSTNSVAAHPYGPLMRDDAGNLYGVTERGGDEDGGTIFSLDPEGELSILHEFGRTDPLNGWPISDDPGGTFPFAGLVGDPAGIVYGTTWTGGDPLHGIVYRFDLRSRAFDVLYDLHAGTRGQCRSSPLARQRWRSVRHHAERRRSGLQSAGGRLSADWLRRGVQDRLRATAASQHRAGCRSAPDADRDTGRYCKGSRAESLIGRHRA